MSVDYPLDLCVNTQTPLLQFAPPDDGLIPPVGSKEVQHISHLVEGVDYRYSPGGVTRMVHPLLRRLHTAGVIGATEWVSLNPFAPRTIRINDVTLHNVAIAPDRLAAYGNVKETIWGTVHGLRETGGSDNLFWSDDFSEYAYYNRLTAETIRSLDAEHDFDLFYIHDFQQLPIGEMLGTLKPKLFRWHIPFDTESIPERWHAAMRGYLNRYDTVVVSTDRYLKQLEEFGYTGRGVRIYPYIDESEYSTPTPAEARSVVERYGVKETDRIVLVVGRMDPMKGQDHAIRALALLAKRFPRLKLLLVGNGSFSGSKSGLGLSKSGTWRTRLEGLAKELGVDGRVLFTGHVTQRELDACYERCELTVLPSLREGFGLVVVESWIHRRPVIVSKRAGIAEIVRNKSNGLLVDPEDPTALAGQIEAVLSDRSALARKLVRGGLVAAKKCTIEAAARAESELLGSAVEG
jgi:glycosyltransferase involved in cell wall biosynthesis